MAKLLDKDGLNHFWQKIKTLLSGKADKDHTHALNDLNVPYAHVGLNYAAAPYVSSARACRTFGIPADQIIIEQSTDGGVTWTEGIDPNTRNPYTNAAKESLFNGSRGYPIYIPVKNGVRSTDCMMRVTITGMKYSVPDGTAETEKYNYWNSNYVLSTERYCSLEFGYFWMCSFSDKISIEHKVATGTNPNNWVFAGEFKRAEGWTGSSYVKFGNGTLFGGGTSQTGGYWNHRFIFRTAASDGSYDDSKLSTSSNTYIQYIQEISCYGVNCYIPANEMMRHDRPYTVDTSGRVRFPNSVFSGGGFIMSGQSDAANKLLTADGWYKHINTFASADHTHSNYVTQTYLDSMRYVSEQDLETQILNTESLIQDVDDRVTTLEQSAHKFKLLGRQTLAANGVADLSTYLAAYDELMIIVRTQSSASVTIGPANNTSGSSGFLCSNSVTGTIYTKIMVNKTDEGYMAWDVGGNVGWSNNTSYKYLRNYVASGTVSMSVVIHGR